MLAYEIVAQTIGASSEWVRKFVNNSEGKEPKLTLGFNILEIYSRVCNRVEQAGDNERKLKGEIDAAIESISLLAGSTQAAPSSSGETSDAG